MSQVAEVVGERSNTLLVRELSKGSLTATILGTIAVGYTFLRLAEKGIGVYEKYLKVRQLKNQIDEQEFGPELTAELEARAAEQYQARLREEASAFVAESAVPAIDQGRKNELVEAINAALKHLSS